MARILFSISLDHSFNEVTAYWMARLSRMAYRDLDGICRETRIFWDNPEVFYFENEESETQACILEYSDKALIGFRGTEPGKLKDWLTDFRFFKTNYKGHRIHGGFLGSLQSLLNVPRCHTSYLEKKAFENGAIVPETFAEKVKQIAANRPIFITGHSLGGALATVAALYFKLEYDLNTHSIYTFGQPKIGGKELVTFFKSSVCSKVFIHVNDEDVVPKVPLRAMKFVHFPITHPYDSTGMLITDPALEAKFQKRIDKGISAIPKLLEGVGDHSMLAYTDHWERSLTDVHS